MKHLEDIQKVLEENGFSYEYDKEDNTIDIGKYSPKDQDFRQNVKVGENMREFILNLQGVYEAYDPEQETMLWVNGPGLGNKGCPSSLRELLEDMEWCEAELKKLLDCFINKIGNEKDY